MRNKALIDKLNRQKFLSEGEWTDLIRTFDNDDRVYAATIARDIAKAHFGTHIFFRGIIEFSNYCRNNCLYCGIRCDNRNAVRYRLTKEDILSCCRHGYDLGFRTFVLQSGEDMYFTDERLLGIVSSIRGRYPDCAITLSVGERSRRSYQALFDAGADRYLLRHETADKEHYSMIHPASLSWENRIKCLNDLKDIGYQTGCGFMVGSPYQQPRHLAKDMLFLREFQPEMVGIGPFIPHKDTPFADFPAGSAELTLFLLSLCRIMLPGVLLPATTALGTLDRNGRMAGVLAGANVIMPNLSPGCVKEKYMLYDNKPVNEDDAAAITLLDGQLAEIGYRLKIGRGDYQQEAWDND